MNRFRQKTVYLYRSTRHFVSWFYLTSFVPFAWLTLNGLDLLVYTPTETDSTTKPYPGMCGGQMRSAFRFSVRSLR